MYGYFAATAYALSPGETQFNNFFIWIVIVAAAVPVCYIIGPLICWATPHRINNKTKYLLKDLLQQQSTPEDNILDAADYQRSCMISGNTANSDYNVLQNSAAGYKSYGIY